MNETLLTWIIFILAFGGMVVVHEFGHFIAARLVKVEVEEFGIGFPTPGALTFWISKGFFFLKNGRRVEIPKNFRMPVFWDELVDREVKITVDDVDGRLILRTIEVVMFDERTQKSARNASADDAVEPREGVRKNVSRNLVKAGKEAGTTTLTDVIEEVHPGTRYTLNWLPIGGFVRPKGENDPNIAGGLAASAPWKRLFVLFAGPFMNLLTAMIVISVIINQMGGIINSPSPDYTGPEQILVTSIVPNDPADKAGLMTGDILLEGAGQPLNKADDLGNVVTSNVNKPTVFLVQRNGQDLEVTITPLMNAEAGRPMIGIGFCSGCQFEPITGIVQNLKYSAEFTGAQIYALVTLPIKLLRGTVDPSQGLLVGLKGIFDIMSQSVSSDVQAANEPKPASSSSSASNPYNAPVNTLSIIALLSISLGIFNLFPFPALDGGRIIFVIPEMIFRRRVPHQFENVVHGVGMLLLLALMIYINVRDFIDPISTKLP